MSIKKAVDVAAQSVSFDFGEDGVEGITVSLGQFTPEMLNQLALHGLSQKLGDSYASAKQATEGSKTTVAQYAAGRVADVMQELVEGNWTVRSAGGGASRVTDLAKALSEATGEALEDCVSKLADADKEVKAQLRKHPAVKAVLDRLSAERAAAKAAKSAEDGAGESVDLGGLFG